MPTPRPPVGGSEEVRARGSVVRASDTEPGWSLVKEIVKVDDRELAVLKTLGFNRRQVRATVAWQAMTLATVGLLIGIPAGLLVGSVVWRAVADGLGVTTTPFVPALGFVLTIPAVLAGVNLIGFFPGRAAARTRPAVALATE